MPASKGDRIETRIGCATIFGCSEFQIGNYMQQGMPYSGKGRRGSPVRIHMPSAIQWLIDKAIKKQQHDVIEPLQARLRAEMGDAAPLSLPEEQLRLTKANADLKDLQAKQLAGDLVPLEDVNQGLRAIFVAMRGAIDGRSGRRAGELAGISDAGRIRAILLSDDRRVFEVAIDRLEALLRDLGSSGTASATTGESSMAVGGGESGTTAGER